MPFIQDALTPMNYEVDTQWELVAINRPQGYILSHTHISKASQISQICISGEEISVQSSSLRTVNGFQGLHQSVGSSGWLSPSTGRSFIPVTGRLPPGGEGPSHTPSDYRVHHQCSIEVGISDQLQEITPAGHSENYISGHGNRYTGVSCVSTQTEGREDGQDCIIVSLNSYLQEGEALFEVSRIDGLDLDDGPQGETLHEISSSLPEFDLGPQDDVSGLPDCNSFETNANHSVVEQSGQFAEGLGVPSQGSIQS
jgi:hypothetical protein